MLKKSILLLTKRIKMRTLTKLGLLLSLAVIPAKIHAEQAQNLKCSRAAYLQAANQNDAAVARLLEQASQADAQAQTAEGIAQRETANYTHEDAVIRYYDVQIKFIRDKDKPGLTSYHTSPHYGTIMAALKDYIRLAAEHTRVREFHAQTARVQTVFATQQRQAATQLRRQATGWQRSRDYYLQYAPLCTYP
jgi:G3E family GTPase